MQNLKWMFQQVWANTRSFYIINKHVQMCTSQTSLPLCFYTPLSLYDFVWSPLKGIMKEVGLHAVKNMAWKVWKSALLNL